MLVRGLAEVVSKVGVRLAAMQLTIFRVRVCKVSEVRCRAFIRSIKSCLCRLSTGTLFLLAGAACEHGGCRVFCVLILRAVVPIRFCYRYGVIVTSLLAR